MENSDGKLVVKATNPKERVVREKETEGRGKFKGHHSWSDT